MGRSPLQEEMATHSNILPGGSWLKALAAGQEMQEMWVGKISPGGSNGHPLQYSHLENPMDKGAQWAIVHRVAKSQIQLSE